MLALEVGWQKNLIPTVDQGSENLPPLLKTSPYRMVYNFRFNAPLNSPSLQKLDKELIQQGAMTSGCTRQKEWGEIIFSSGLTITLSTYLEMVSIMSCSLSIVPSSPSKSLGSLSTTVFFSTSTDIAKLLWFSNVSTNNELNKNQKNQMFDWPLDNLH